MLSNSERTNRNKKMSITFEHNPLTFSFSGPTRRAYRYIKLKLFVETALHFNKSAIDIGDSCLDKRGNEPQDNNVVGQLANGEDCARYH